MEKARESREDVSSCFTDYTEASDWGIPTKCGRSSEGWECRSPDSSPEEPKPASPLLHLPSFLAEDGHVAAILALEKPGLVCLRASHPGERDPHWYGNLEARALPGFFHLNHTNWPGDVYPPHSESSPEHDYFAAEGNQEARGLGQLRGQSLCHFKNLSSFLPGAPKGPRLQPSPPGDAQDPAPKVSLASEEKRHQKGERNATEKGGERKHLLIVFSLAPDFISHTLLHFPNHTSKQDLKNRRCLSLVGLSRALGATGGNQELPTQENPICLLQGQSPEFTRGTHDCWPHHFLEILSVSFLQESSLSVFVQPSTGTNYIRAADPRPDITRCLCV
ncbi:uncharacterized protein LOC144455975 [Phascolarctos cinereus]